MSLDPEIRRMLEALKAARTDPPAPVTLEEARAVYRRQYLEMSAGPQGHVGEETLPLSKDGAALTLYRPSDSDRPLPLILYLHGGGFVLGDSRTYARQSARLAEACGALVAFLDYRLAPEHPFPAALDDTLLAVETLRRTGAARGADLSRFALMGDSAGGNLAIAAMRHFRSPSPFRHVALLYPVTDLRPYAGLAPFTASDDAYAAGHFLERPAMAYFARSYAPEASTTLDPRVSPMLAEDLSGLPPVDVYGGEYDLLRDQGAAFVHRLEEAGNRVGYRRFDGLIHNFMQQAGISKASDDAFRIVCDDMRAAIGRPSGLDP